MEVEGSSLQVSRAGERGDDEASTTPTRTPAQKWTETEAKWYDDHWSYDENAPCGAEGGSHSHVWDGGLGNGEASKMPTRALPRRWTLKEEEWYADHWSYDGSTRDKVRSGEYVLVRPPKKPGGTVRICLFLLSIFMAIDSAESKGEGDDMQWSLKLWLRRMVGGMMTFLLCTMILGVIASRKKLYRLWEDVLITNQVVVPLMRAIEAFKARHNIDREEDRNMAHFVLWERFVGDFHELNDEDPKKRVESFFSKIDKDISNAITDASCEHKEAVKVCIRKLHNLNQIRDTPAFALDLPFWAMLFILIEIMYFNNLRGSLKDNTLGLAAAMMLLILCYDNSDTLLDKWGGLGKRMTRANSGLYLRQLLDNGRRLGMWMTGAANIECVLWMFRFAILIMVWSKKGRAYLEEHICAQIAMSVIIYLLAGNQHVVLDKLEHIKTGMGRGVAAIIVGIQQIFDEVRAWGTQVVNTILFGNFCIYICAHSAATMIGSFTSDALSVLSEHSVVLNDSEFKYGTSIPSDNESSGTQKEDCNTVTTAGESIDASWTEYSDEEHFTSDGRWCMVVNGTQYVGHARPDGNSSFGTEKNYSDQLIVREETTKE